MLPEDNMTSWEILGRILFILFYFILFYFINAHNFTSNPFGF